MTLWDLLLAICFCVGVASALTAASGLGGGLGGYISALVAGSLIGSYSVWMLSKLAAIVNAYSSGAQSKFRKDWAAGTLYCFAILWVGFVGVLATQVTSGLVRLVIHRR